MKTFVGLGFDIHKFSRRRKNLVLGGVKIDYPYGLEAVSDGDVILHSISDAILGALSQGDIGDYFFPQNTPQDMDSKKIVDFVLKKLGRKKILNVDVTLILDRPRISSYKKMIVDSLKKIFKAKRINLKIKSKEGTDFLGGENSVVCLSLVSLVEC
ncbi:MAG: 2-C-methyl-D-erythritol 2,4-cyclodiphosphate synthase [Candidatus Omnitrophica bacterium 4484_70.1]|nr:MAG: 2-C-methyl-D-erythritol 2,4-cyclodiphosphate synthase [Candidatus Omnitrophica bacterium 4484_70.1]